MFSKRSISLGVFSCLLLSGCSVVSSVLPEKAMTNVLSGREGANGQVLVVKIDDTTQAHPQIGLEDADIVYIEQVEGGLTRLAAVFSSVIPERVVVQMQVHRILVCRGLLQHRTNHRRASRYQNQRKGRSRSGSPRAKCDAKTPR